MVWTTVLDNPYRTDDSIIQTLIKVVLSVILLSNISFETMYARVGSIQNIYSGTAPFNLSLAYQAGASEIISETFMGYTGNLLFNTISVVPFPPSTSTCKAAGENCFSYIMPGDLGVVEEFSYGMLDHNGSTTFVSMKAPAYLLEYYPVQGDVVFENSDCLDFETLLSVSSDPSFVIGSLLRICLKNTGNDLIAGFSLQQ